MNASDLRRLRNAFGSFITGVTVVTTREADGTPRGFTANSFASVSLDPPLLLVCIGKSADSHPVFTAADGFAVNILAAEQIDTSGLFASKRADKFERADWYAGPGGLPLLRDVCAWFECGLENLHYAGDHTILIGRVRAFDYGDHTGLGFVRGGYVNLALEQEAVRAAATGVGTGVVVGAIVEHDDRVMLVQDAQTGKWRLPASGLDGSPGALNQLLDLLAEFGVRASIAALFAVFENRRSGQQSIYYRAFCEAVEGDHLFRAHADLPWDKLASKPLATMLKRYFAEKENQRFGIYFGSDQSGAVKLIADD